MRIYVYTALLVICMNMPAASALAQDLNIPDRDQRQGMSYEEYSALREKMRARLEKMTPSERQAQREKWQENRLNQRDEVRTYGLGYQARRHDMEKPANQPDKPNLPERLYKPEVPQRPDKADMPQRMERFQRP